MASIASLLPPEDLFNFRSTCRAINNQSYLTFAERFFETRRIMLHSESLKSLIDVSQHDVLSSRVRTLEFCCCDLYDREYFGNVISLQKLDV